METVATISAYMHPQVVLPTVTPPFLSSEPRPKIDMCAYVRTIFVGLMSGESRALLFFERAWGS